MQRDVPLVLRPDACLLLLLAGRLSIAGAVVDRELLRRKSNWQERRRVRALGWRACHLAGCRGGLDFLDVVAAGILCYGFTNLLLDCLDECASRKSEGEVGDESYKETAEDYSPWLPVT